MHFILEIRAVLILHEASVLSDTAEKSLTADSAVVDPSTAYLYTEELLFGSAIRYDYDANSLQGITYEHTRL